MKKRILRYIISFVIIMSLIAWWAVPVIAATSANVSVTGTGAFVSYTANQSSYDFGVLNTSSTTNTSGQWIGFTNTSTVSTNISVKMLASTWESVGSGWTHSDTAAGANTVAMKANSSNLSTWSSSVFIKYNSPFEEIGQAIAPGSAYTSGLSLLAATSWDDGSTNNNTIMFSFYSE